MLINTVSEELNSSPLTLVSIVTSDCNNDGRREGAAGDCQVHSPLYGVGGCIRHCESSAETYRDRVWKNQRRVYHVSTGLYAAIL